MLLSELSRVFSLSFYLSFVCFCSAVSVTHCRHSLTANGSGLCEVAENRRRKFRFRRHVAKANFYLLIYEKESIKLAFAKYEAQSFNLDETPPFCKTLVSGRLFCQFDIR